MTRFISVMWEIKPHQMCVQYVQYVEFESPQENCEGVYLNLTTDRSVSVCVLQMEIVQAVTGPHIYRAPDNLSNLHGMFVCWLNKNGWAAHPLHIMFCPISHSREQKQTHTKQTDIFPRVHTQTCPWRLLFKWQTLCLELFQEHVTYVQVSSDVNGYSAPSDALELVT